MKKAYMIFITGLPCTGKTTLGKRLAKDLGVPFFFKDLFKEIMFDHIDWSDRTWSKKLGVAAYEMLYATVALFAAVKQSAIIEANFPSQYATPRLHALQEKYDFIPIQIRCITQGDVLLERFTARAHTAHRHPGHRDKESVEEWKKTLLTGTIEPLDLGVPVFDVDTTDFSCVDYDAITKHITTQMQSA